MRRRGFTMMELVVALAIMTLLVAGLASAIVLSARAMDSNDAPVHQKTQSADVLDQVLADLKLAKVFSDLSANEAVFIVPDRDNPADGTSELIRLAWSGTPGDPLTCQHNGGPVVNLAQNVHQFNLTNLMRTVPPEVTGAPTVDPNSWGYFLSDVQPANRLLFVSAGSSLWVPLVGDFVFFYTAQEQLRVDQLESWGYIVTPIEHTDSQTNFDVALGDADVAYVSEEIDADDVDTKLTSTAVGVVNEETQLWDELEFAVDNPMWKDRTEIRIDDNTHYITDGLSTGLLTVFTSIQSVGLCPQEIAPGAQVLCSTFNTGTQYRASLLAMDTGAEMQDGAPAPGRRVNLPWGGSAFDFDALNNDGLTIMQKAVEWAAGAGEGGGGGSGVFGYDTEFPTEVTDLVPKQIATQAVMPVDGDVTRIWGYVKGKNNKRVRYAIYTDAGGEPGSLIVQSTKEKTNDGTYWMSIDIPATTLTAGTYWLALSFDHSAMGYQHDSGAAGQTRYRNWNGCSDGYLSNWGTSDDSFTVKVAIYGEYTPN